MAVKSVKRFKEGDEVTWSSQAGGSMKVKIGEVVEVVPAGKSILKSRFRNELDASKLCRIYRQRDQVQGLPHHTPGHPDLLPGPAAGTK